MTFFDVKPNWADGVKLTSVFSTDIFASRDGTEQRRAQRFKPRRTLEFSAWEHIDDAHDLKSLIKAGMPTVMTVPDYTRRVVITTDLTEAGSIVDIETVPEWVFPGAVVALSRRGSSQEFEVAGVAGNTVTFFSGSTAFVLAGSSMHPIFSGFFSPSLRGDSIINKVFQAGVSFEEFPGTSVHDDVTAWPDTYAGLPLFERSPDYGDRPRVTIADTRESADFGKGRLDFNSPRGYASQVLQFGHTGKNLEDSRSLVNFFVAQKGRRGEFWLPSWSADMVLAEPALLAANMLVMKGPNLSLLANDPTHRHISIHLKSGERRKLAITAISENLGNSELSLDSALVQGLDPEDIVSISWLYRARFATDSASFDWITSSVMDTTFNFQTLREAAL